LSGFTLELPQTASGLASWGVSFFDVLSPNIFFGQLHEEPVASPPAPAVAFDAADEPFAVMVDFDD